MQDDETRIERWLNEAVAPVYDAMKAQPARGIPADQVFAEIRRRHSVEQKVEARELSPEIKP